MIEKPRLHHGRKIEQVFRGAREVFLRDGYAGASVDDIARAAKVSKATLYSYFPEKELMYREVLLDQISRLGAEEAIRIDPAAAPAEALPTMARQIAGWQVSIPAVQLLRASIAEAERFPDLARRYHQILTRLLRDSVRVHLERWVAAGQLWIEDIDLAAEQFVRLAGAVLHEQALLGEPREARDGVIHKISDSAAQLFIAAHRADGRCKTPLSAVS